MIAAVLLAAAAMKAPTSPFAWSEEYWAAQRLFQACYDRRTTRELRRGRAAQLILDRVMTTCRREWYGRVAAMQADIRRRQPNWSDFTVNDYLQWRYRDFYDTRLERLRYATGELVYPNIQ
jgi:hypothetical protein